MKKQIILFVGLLIFISGYSQTRVKGYYRADGTYVQPYMRQSPDGNFGNNYSTKGNINPYTGVSGTKTVDPNSGRAYNNAVTIYSRPINQRLVSIRQHKLDEIQHRISTESFESLSSRQAKAMYRQQERAIKRLMKAKYPRDRSGLVYGITLGGLIVFVLSMGTMTD